MAEDDLERLFFLAQIAAAIDELVSSSCGLRRPSAVTNVCFGAK
jgi:hypothetical protein